MTLQTRVLNTMSFIQTPKLQIINNPTLAGPAVQNIYKKHTKFEWVFKLTIFRAKINESVLIVIVLHLSYMTTNQIFKKSDFA